MYYIALLPGSNPGSNNCTTEKQEKASLVPKPSHPNVCSRGRLGKAYHVQ